MLSAFLKAVAQLNDPATRRVVWRSVGAAIAVFAGLGLGIGYLLSATAFFTLPWLELVADMLGGLATVVVTWLLFPAVISAVIAFFLEDIAGAVEARHYPGLPAARGPSVFQILWPTARFLGMVVLLNLLILPFIIIAPVFPFVFYSVNGYLLGREYFELVALRRMAPQDIRALRKARRGRLFATGVVIAFLLTVPVVNLLAPIIATAVMVHLFEAWRPAARHHDEGP